MKSTFAVFVLHPARLIASITPVLLALLAAAFANLPISLTAGLVPAPLLALGPIYFWGLVRPDLMPPPAILLIGLCEDIFSGGPPGLWCAGFLAAGAVTDRYRDALAGLSGMGAVLGFVTAVFAAATTAFLLASLVYWRWAPLAPLMLECAMTVLFYPPFAMLMGWLHRHFVGALRGDD